MLRRHHTDHAKHAKPIAQPLGGSQADGSTASIRATQPDGATPRRAGRGCGVLVAAAIGSVATSLARPAISFWFAMLCGLIVLGLLALAAGVLRLVRAILFEPSNTPYNRALALLSTTLSIHLGGAADQADLLVDAIDGTRATGLFARRDRADA